MKNCPGNVHPVVLQDVHCQGNFSLQLHHRKAEDVAFSADFLQGPVGYGVVYGDDHQRRIGRENRRSTMSLNVGPEL